MSGEKKSGGKKKGFFLIKIMGIPFNRIKKEFFLKNVYSFKRDDRQYKHVITNETKGNPKKKWG